MEARRKSVVSELVVDVFFTNLIRGKDGLTPSIGANGNWFIGNDDTGVLARGSDGKDGLTPSIGENGNWEIGGNDTGVSGNGIPSGVIVMWSGSVANIPNGWRLCDGSGILNNGIRVPDLRGRFVVGYDSRDSDYSNVGSSGGSKEIVLTEAQMPSHNHWIRNVEKGAAGGTKSDDGPGSYNNTSDRFFEYVYSSYTGGKNPPSGGGKASSTEAHENRPPYYVLAYIIKL